jgi:hypothetical protein
MPLTSAPAAFVDRFMDGVRNLCRLDRRDDLVVDDCHLCVGEVRTVRDGSRLTSHATRWWTPAACSTNEADWRLLS